MVKIIIPAAGIGKRMFPYTFLKPKPMIKFQGRPILSYILDGVQKINPEEIIIVVGYKKEYIISYVNDHYKNLNICFVEQQEQLGLAHAIYKCWSMENSDIIIALADVIPITGYQDIYEYGHHTCTSTVGIQVVDDPKKYGVVEVDYNNHILSLEEKPKNPKSNLVLSGIYYIQESNCLMNIIDHMIMKNNKVNGEFQLTTALQEFIKNHYVNAYNLPVYDCGSKESLLRL